METESREENPRVQGFTNGGVIEAVCLGGPFGFYRRKKLNEKVLSIV
jgi:hypothetical protein